MRLVVAAVGRLKRGPERELAERYRARAAQAGRAIAFRGADEIECDESRARRAEDRMAEEAAVLAASLPERGAIVALDAAGRSLTSEALAAQLAAWRDAGRPAVTFVIGGADGLAPALADRAELRLAFGAVTWPHQLVRIMIWEQIYRAVTIIAGHPYHRA